MCSSSQVYDSFSLRADSLMGEFKVGHFNCIKILIRFRIFKLFSFFLHVQLDVGYIYDEPG